MKNNIRTFVMVGLSLYLASCDQIPSAYRGTYYDAANDVTLKLTSKKGVLTFKDKTQIQSKTIAEDIANLETGKTGIYIQKNLEKSFFDISWINPVVSTIKSDAMMVWMDSEVLTFDLRMKPSKTQVIKAIYCKDGKVELNKDSYRWQAGCNSNSQTFNLIKQK